jgi:hypothetical protein
LEEKSFRKGDNPENRMESENEIKLRNFSEMGNESYGICHFPKQSDTTTEIQRKRKRKRKVQSAKICERVRE